MLVAMAVLSVCCAVALYGYWVHPPRAAHEPPHILFSSNGGPVLFPHGHHRQDSGAAIECAECHHTSDSGTNTAAEMQCRECHYDDPEVVEAVCADDNIHPRCIGKQCNNCHDGEACTFCHRKQP
ncbi:MAG: cytochrome c3 family protein [Chitinispirillaceae bacterium]|nr:cytochrome c3 family protein [Chitinispirillaceae bacterium]